MAWVRLDDTFPEHPKIIAIGGDAAWLHVCALSYSNRNFTDGKIPEPAVTRLSDRRNVPKLVERLLAHLVWHQPGETCDSEFCPCYQQPAPDGVYVIHDFFEYQQSRADYDEKHEAKVRAGQAGGIASGRTRAKQTASRGEASASRLVEANGKQIEAPTRPDPYPLSSDLQKSVLPEDSLQISGAVDNQAHPGDPVSLLSRRLGQRAEKDGFTKEARR
jgi:hypothetical protein